MNEYNISDLRSAMYPPKFSAVDITTYVVIGVSLVVMFLMFYFLVFSKTKNDDGSNKYTTGEALGWSLLCAVCVMTALFLIGKMRELFDRRDYD